MTRRMVFWTIVLILLLCLISLASAFSPDYENLAEEGKLDCSLAKITFFEKNITLTYCDGSEEMIPNYHVPREILKKKLTLDGTTIRVDKLYFDIVGNPDLVYMLEGTASRWKYAFSARSYF